MRRWEIPDHGYLRQVGMSSNKIIVSFLEVDPNQLPPTRCLTFDESKSRWEKVASLRPNRRQQIFHFFFSKKVQFTSFRLPFPTHLCALFDCPKLVSFYSTWLGIHLPQIQFTGPRLIVIWSFTPIAKGFARHKHPQFKSKITECATVNLLTIYSSLFSLWTPHPFSIKRLLNRC